VQLGGGGQPRRGVAGGEARKRRLAGLAVGAVVVVALDPGGEQPVALGEVGGAAAGVQLDQELLTDGAEEPFDLAAPLRLTRPGVDQADAQDRAGPQQLAGTERRAVVHVDPVGHPTGGEP
jgi:hypothetical protein